ncbi:MAG: ribulose-phosphate 3-epimerase [Eubacterium sp.]
MKNLKISPSMLSADFANLERDLKMVEASGADWLHVDVMDGHFVPNITIGPDQIKCLRKTITLPFDVHLMISEPLKYIEAFAAAGADLITVHVEVEEDTNDCISLIKKCGCKAGLVLSPDTDSRVLEPFMDDISMVLLMGVYPGFGGQKYIESTTEKLRAVRHMIGDRDIDLEIDGGINFETLSTVVEAGANVIVSGSCLFNGNMKENIGRFHTIIGGIKK